MASRAPERAWCINSKCPALRECTRSAVRLPESAITELRLWMRPEPPRGADRCDRFETLGEPQAS